MSDSKKNFFTTVPGIILAVIGGIILAALFAVVFGWVVMFLWNAVVTKVFTGVNEISFLQAFGLIILCKILLAPTQWKKSEKNKKHKKYHDECGAPWGKWKYYDSYWKEEGKAAYENYVANKEHGSDKNGNHVE